jgi:hypothetical protein
MQPRRRHRRRRSQRWLPEAPEALPDLNVSVEMDDRQRYGAGFLWAEMTDQSPREETLAA